MLQAATGPGSVVPDVTDAGGLGTTALILALAAILIPSVVSVWSIRATNRNARESREHERTMAREAHEHQLQAAWERRDAESRERQQERNQERRADAYLLALTAIYRLSDLFERTMPILGGLPPPEPLSDDELRLLNARTALLGSRHVKDALREFTQLQIRFHFEADTLQDLRGREDGIADKRIELEETREQLRAARDRLVELMSAEVQGLALDAGPEEGLFTGSRQETTGER